MFGINGAAYSIIIAFFLMSASIYIKLKNFYVIPFDWKSVLFPITFLLMFSNELCASINSTFFMYPFSCIMVYISFE